MTTTVKAFITVLGQTIVGRVVERREEEVKLEGALFFGPQQDPDTGKVGLGYTPIALTAPGNPQDGMEICLKNVHIVIEHELAEAAIEAYDRVTGRIQVAPASAIATLDDKRNKKK